MLSYDKESFMQALIIDIINKFGYLGVLLLIAIENIFPPIPSEIILTFGGFMTKMPNSSLTIVGVIIASTLGSLLGAIALYYIGKILNKERLKKIVSGKIGKILFLKPKDIEKADKWFDEKGNKTVFFCRFVPVIRSLISIPAGMSEMKMSKFLIYTIAGSVIWNTVLVILGSIVGENWESVAAVFDTYSKITVIVLGILFIILVSIFYYKKRKTIETKNNK
jgi:membrane protein DedA with SNARE-associated domain